MIQRNMKQRARTDNEISKLDNAKRVGKLNETEQSRQSKKVKFTTEKRPYDSVKIPDQQEINKNKSKSESNTYEGDSPAIEAVKKGLRRSSRLNPEIQKGESLVALQAKISKYPFRESSVPGEILSMPIEESTTSQECTDPMVLKASSDPDIMYLHEAMRQKDRKEFVNAMEKEVHDQMANGNFTIVHKSKVPKGKVILPAVWQLRRKRDIQTRQVKKYKARLNIDGSRMKPGVHYDQTYAPVASWNSIRLLLILVATMG